MACSKFFSGDLPELLNEVIQYFHYDYKTLHSCILVNRLWCRLAIPLLWEDPFSIKSPKNYRFIEIYLCNLSDDDKTRLKEYVGHSGLFPSNTLFNYPKFIQHLDICKICYSIEKWASTNVSHSQMLNFTKLIFRLLFLLFIENEANLHSFGVTDDYEEFECFNETFELILQNTNFIYDIKNLTLDFGEMTDNITKFLGFLCSNCNSISSLRFLFPIINNDHPIIEKMLSQMIKLQENLKRISFCYSDPPLSLLLSLNNPNCSNTLKIIIFYYIDFKNINILSEVFNQLNVLESIHIICCSSLDSKFIQQINNITKQFKLKSLFLNTMDELLVEPLIQKSGNYLENFGFTRCELQQLLQSLKLLCNNIKFLSIRLQKDINLMLNLIKNISHNLNYLIINSFNIYGDDIKFNSIVLQNLGQILPFKLEYLNLHLAINGNDLKVFLKNSQNTYIKKFLISNTKNDDILPYIKEYIVKKKRVKYLAIFDGFYKRKGDLSHFKDIVKEFQLHDIQVIGYYDSVIDDYDFVNENY